jgi:glutamate-1-semialdehyde aminotransferase
MKHPEYTQSLALYERARAVIPGGIVGIRSPENFVQGDYPVFLAGGAGAYVSDVDGNRFLDMLLGYGPMILGHACAEVDRAAAETMAAGFCLNLPQAIQVELAERLVDLVPSAEQAMFFKTGSDATSAAVRLARAHSGRETVLRCGYHGWHDWCLLDDPGVPRAVSEPVIPFAYNRADQLEDLLKRHRGRVAAIIMTPVGHDFDAQIETPATGFLERARALANEHEAVLIFDEVRTGFRLGMGGAQALYGVTPDLTALGKAMSNGYPVSALVGRREVMQAAQSTFISSTYFPNGLSMAAASATLDILQRDQVPAQIASMGRSLHNGLSSIVDDSALPVTLSPYPQMPFLYFDRSLAAGQDARRDRFYGALARRGIFAHPRHHGFLSCCHGEKEITRVLETVRDVARTLACKPEKVCACYACNTSRGGVAPCQSIAAPGATVIAGPCTGTRSSTTLSRMPCQNMPNSPRAGYSTKTCPR